MKENNQDSIYNIQDLPVAPTVKVQKRPKWGLVPGLDEDETADPAELQREVFQKEWAPILMLPTPKRRYGITPNTDESGGIDWGAFATVDFERLRPALDKGRYRIDRLREEVKDALLLSQTIGGRLTANARREVLSQLESGRMTLADVVNPDIHAWASLRVRARRLQREIQKLMKARWERRERMAAAMLAE